MPRIPYTQTVGRVANKRVNIVLLYYFAEWTDRRIAEELGCPRSTVQFRRSKALLALRARLEEVIGDDEL